MKKEYSKLLIIIFFICSLLFVNHSFGKNIEGKEKRHNKTCAELVSLSNNKKNNGISVNTIFVNPSIALDSGNITGAGGININTKGCSSGYELLDNTNTGATSTFTSPNGLVMSMAITLANPQDGTNEQLSIGGIFAGISVAGNNTASLVITNNGSASTNAMRNVLSDLIYKDLAANPNTTVQRNLTVIITDITGLTSNTANAFLNVTKAANSGNATGPLYVFTTGTTVDLFTGLDGTQDAGGTWIDVDGTGSLTGSIVTIPTLPLGGSTFRYDVVATAPCETSSVIVVVIKMDVNELGITSPNSCGVIETQYSNALYSANSNDPIFTNIVGNTSGQLVCPAGTGATTYDWYKFNSVTNSYSKYALGSTASQVNLPDGGYLIVRTDLNGVKEGRAWIWNLPSGIPNAGLDISVCEGIATSLSGNVGGTTQIFNYYNPVPRPLVITNTTKISVKFSATHTYVSDLGFYLVNPAGTKTITLGANQGNTCNSGSNVSNLTFTNQTPNAYFNFCTMPAPLTGTFNGYFTGPSGETPANTNKLINWTPLVGEDGNAGGWKVRIYDCVGADVGNLTNVTIIFDDGAGNVRTYTSGSITVPITDNSCTPATASTYTVPSPSAVVIPYTLTISDNVGVGGAVGGYQWSYSTSGLSGPYSNFNNSTLTPSLSFNTNTWVKLALDNGLGTCIIDDTLFVTVNPSPSINTTQAATVCSGSTFSVTPTNGSGNTIPLGTTYSWSAPVVAGITGAVAGTNATAISGTLTNTTNAAIIVTYYLAPTSGSCTGTSFPVTVTVNPKPSITTAQAATICSGNNFVVTPTNGGGNTIPSGTTYSWSAPVVAGITGTTSGTNATNITDTLNNTTNASIIVSYTVTPNSGSCSGSSFVVNITVNPTPMGVAVAKTICSGRQTVNQVLTTSPFISGTTFTYPTPVVTGGLTGGNGRNTGSTADITDILVNPTSSIQTATYTITPTAPSGCVGSTFTVVVTVSPVPVLTASQVQNLCANTGGNSTANLTLTTTPSSSSASFTWTPPVLSGGMTYTDNGFGTGTITDNYNNPTTQPQTATYSVTPIASGSLGGCIGDVTTVVITVNPNPIVTSGLAQTICSGQTTNRSLSSTTTGVVYSYPAPTISGAPGNITGGTSRLVPSNVAITDLLTNTTGVVQTATYMVTALINGCAGNPVAVVITVNPTPSGVVALKTICSGQTVNQVLTTNPVVSGTTFTYSIPVVTGGITGGTARSTGSTADITDVFVNPTGVSQTATYTVTPAAPTGCLGTTFTVTITVNPTPATPTTTTVQPSCTVSTGTITITAPVSAGMTYSIDGLTYTNTTGIFNLVPTGTYTVTAKSIDGCISSGTGVTVDPQPATPSIPALGVPTQGTCVYTLGSTVLSGLPSGNWTINQNGTYTATYSSSGSSYLITALAPGTYNFTVTNSIGCTSGTTANTTLNNIICAVADTNATAINGYTGGTAIANVLANDKLNGVAVLPSEVLVTLATALPSGISFNTSTGEVAVNAGTPAGTYTFDYSICEVLNPANCSTTTVTVNVAQAPILAVADTNATTTNGYTGGTAIANVLSNDTLNGVAVIPSQVLVTLASVLPTGITFNTSTGEVAVNAGTPAGTYTFDYSICEVLNPANCSTITITVNVGQAPILAVADTNATAVNGYTGGTAIANVLANDTLNGVAVIPSQVLVTLASVLPTGITFNTSTGEVAVNAGTPAGTYTFDYSICEVLNPANCSTITITVNVAQAPILAVADTNATAVNGYIGGTAIANVLANDTLNGVAVIPNQVLVTLASVLPTGITFNTSTGEVAVNAGTPAGTYTFDYSICEVLNPANCSTITITVNVGQAPILAVADTNATAVNGYTGGTAIANVLANDTLNGVAVIPSQVLVTLASVLPTGITFNTSTGEVAVNAGTPAGTYTFDYSICEVLNPANCSTITITVNVAQAPILAVADTNATAVNGYIGGTAIANVLANDTLNGVAVIPNQVLVTLASVLPTGITFNTSTGEVAVNAGTPAGTYTFDYSICEVLNPANCSTITITVNVAQAPILAVADTNATAVNGYIGGTAIANILANDTLNGVAVIPSQVLVTLASVLPTGITFNTSTGEVAVNAGTPAGTYTFDYSICEVLNPANCSTITITVNVAQAPILAVADTNATAVNGYIGGTAIANVLANDTLNGVAVIPNQVLVTLASVLPTGITFNTSTGEVAVNAGTPAGTYTFDYSICEVLNPANCSTITITVNVAQAPILAVADTNATAVNGYIGGTAIANILANDTLNGVAVIPSQVLVTLASVLPTGITFNTSTGEVAVNAGTPAGTYTFDYSICEVLNPANCSTIKITVNVAQAPILAVADTNATTINGYTGGTAIANVLSNDTLNGVAVIPSQVLVTLASVLPTGITFNTSTGEVAVNAGTPAGTYTFDYSICEVLNPANCSTITITVNVGQAPISAINDSVVSVVGINQIVTVINVLTNDKLNGIAVNSTQIVLSLTVADSSGFMTLNTDGTVVLAPNTPAGTYTLKYQICEILNPSNCSTGVVTVSVVAPTMTITTSSLCLNNTPYVSYTVTPDNFTTTNLLIVKWIDSANNVVATLTNLPLTGQLLWPGTLRDSNGKTIDWPGWILSNGKWIQGSDGFELTKPAVTMEFSLEIAQSVIINYPSATAICNSAPTFSIDAVNDSATTPVNSQGGALGVINIFGNDTLNTVNIKASDVIVTVLTSSPNLLLNPDGTIDVLPNTPAGTYTLTYQICEKANSSNCDTATVTVLVQIPAMTLIKTATLAGSVLAGETITYTFTITNTGNIAINNIVINDALLSVTPIAVTNSLAIGSVIIIKVNYLITQADIDLGKVVNSATASGVDTNGGSLSVVSDNGNSIVGGDRTTVLQLTQKPSIAIIKTVVFEDDNNDGFAQVGETVAYRFVITNTGNVPLSNVKIEDLLPGIIIKGEPISLGVGQVDENTFTASYKLKQSDITLGSITNQASVEGTSLNGTNVKDLSDDLNNGSDNATVLALSGCVVEVFNAVSPNGDGYNDVFYIRGLECYPENTVEIYNRWGVLVFERNGYNNTDRTFIGISEGRVTITQAEKLPVGTYYYVLKYKTGSTDTVKKAGYLYINIK
ncbi:T9SS type B sorting domain-containing protein [Flavobacterium sp. Sr18]|uniref:PKD-like domain-containing protein n=1 Tax=Flavobacterium sp. Sr18 TaxID=935222 RepID=UPI0013E4433A|nr:PKD-like domain-containing protein [Flavobacterium sp. Sr18]QIH40022.1 T9SS type B sorting domain-containing protein [Flavobacterium sp. Sr18]